MCFFVLLHLDRTGNHKSNPLLYHNIEEHVNVRKAVDFACLLSLLDYRVNLFLYSSICFLTVLNSYFCRQYFRIGDNKRWRQSILVSFYFCEVTDVTHVFYESLPFVCLARYLHLHSQRCCSNIVLTPFRKHAHAIYTEIFNVVKTKMFSSKFLIFFSFLLKT